MCLKKRIIREMFLRTMPAKQVLLLLRLFFGQDLQNKTRITFYFVCFSLHLTHRGREQEMRWRSSSLACSLTSLCLYLCRKMFWFLFFLFFLRPSTVQRKKLAFQTSDKFLHRGNMWTFSDNTTVQTFRGTKWSVSREQDWSASSASSHCPTYSSC